MSTLVSASFAQMTLPVMMSPNDAAQYGKAPQANNLNKALGATVWSNDFSTASDWVTDNASQTSPFGWNIGTTVNSWWTAFSGGITSTSGGNFAEVYNGNYSNDDQAINVVYTLTTASAIDVSALTSGADAALLEFEQYGAKFNDLQEVQISVDGSTFTTVYDNNDKETFLGNNPSAYFANPEHVSVNITSAIAASPSTVWIRFSWTSRFPSDPALGAWTTFGWFIDDLALVSLPDNDLLVSEATWGAETNLTYILGLEQYFKIPTSQVAPITFATFVTNEGVNQATNALLAVDVNSGLYNGTAMLDTILVGQLDTLLEVSTPFTPAATALSYTFNWALTNDSIDDIPVNNTLVDGDFEVGGLVYQKDRGTIAGGFNRGEEAHEIGNAFTAFGAETVYSIDFVVGSSSDAGSDVLVKLYEVTPVAGAIPLFSELAYSLDYTITAADISSNALISLKLTSPYTLTAGTAYAAVVQTYGGTDAAFVCATSGSETGFLYLEDDASWYTIGSTPMVRMNFENLLTATIESSSTASPICKGDVVNFTSNAEGGTAPYSYSWNFGDGNSSTLANDTHSYTSSGTKTITYTVTDDAVPTANVVTESITVSIANCFTSIDENNLNGVVVSQNTPNPFNETSVVNFELTSSEVVTFEILDVTGKLVQTINLGTLNSGSHAVTFDSKELNSGIYYYSLVTGTSRITNKMVVKK